MRKSLFILVGVGMFLSACEPIKTSTGPQEVKNHGVYKGAPYTQKVAVDLFQRVKGHIVPVKGSCRYRYGNKEGMVKAGQGLGLPVTDQPRTLLLDCRGIGKDRLPSGEIAQYNMRGGAKITTNFNAQGVIYGLKLPQDNAVLPPRKDIEKMIGLRQEMITKEGVRILPQIIAIETKKVSLRK